MKQKTKKKRKQNQSDLASQILTAMISVLFMAIVVIVMIGLTRQLYKFGYNIFGEKPGDSVEIEIDFEVMEGEQARTTAQRLKEKNLISSEVTFIIQKILYEKEIIAGVHVLDSNMTTLEILEELSKSPGRTDDH